MLLFFSYGATLPFASRSATALSRGLDSFPSEEKVKTYYRAQLFTSIQSSLGVHQLNVLVVGLEGTEVQHVASSLEKVGSDTRVEAMEVPYAEVANPSGRLVIGNFVPDLVVLVTDSTQQNVSKSRNIVRILNKQFTGVEKIAVANKQSQPELLSPEEVGVVLGLTTYERIPD